MPQVGPGSYTVQNPPSKMYPSYVPFATSTARGFDPEQTSHAVMPNSCLTVALATVPAHAVHTGRDVLSSKTHRQECLQGSKVAVLLCSTILDLGSIASFHRPLQAPCTPAHVSSVMCQDCMKAGQYSASSASEHLNVNAKMFRKFCHLASLWMQQ